MVSLKRKLIAAAVALVLSTGGSVLAQKGDKRPPKPKDPPKVVVTPKGGKQPQNSNQGNKGKGNKKGDDE